jgi:ankyrin repeat protein
MRSEQRLFAAIEAGQIETVHELVSGDRTLVDARNTSGLSAILVATYYGRNEIAKLLIDAGAHLTIHEAAATGAQERLEQILQMDPSAINSYSVDGWTPLHLAVFFGRVNIVHLLHSKGADLNAVSKSDERVKPLHSALANPNNAAVAQLLIDYGADVNATQALGYTPLHYAASYGLEGIVRNLLSHSVDRKARTIEGKTAQDLAIEKGHAAVADLLKAD